MPNLVEELSANYFTEFFSGALFLNGDNLFQVESANRTRVAVRAFTPAGTGDSQSIPADFFTGYKTFEYPILGYRRLGPHKNAYLTRRQTTARGLRPNSIISNITPASNMLRELGLVPPEPSSLAERMKAYTAFKPVFDTLDELPAMLNGDKFGLVLSPSILIEPSVDAVNDWFNVYYRQSIIGKMNSRGAVTWTSPAYSALLPEIG